MAVSKLEEFLRGCGLTSWEYPTDSSSDPYWKPNSSKMSSESAVVTINRKSPHLIEINPFFKKSDDALECDQLTGDEQLVNYVYPEKYISSSLYPVIIGFCDKWNAKIPCNYMSILGSDRFEINYRSLDAWNTDMLHELIMDVLKMHEKIDSTKMSDSIDAF